MAEELSLSFQRDCLIHSWIAFSCHHTRVDLEIMIAKMIFQFSQNFINPELQHDHRLQFNVMARTKIVHQISEKCTKEKFSKTSFEEQCSRHASANASFVTASVRNEKHSENT